MNSLKEKVADRLSRLLADSPSSHAIPDDSSPHHSAPSQTTAFSAEQLNSPRSSSLSSYLVSFLPKSTSAREHHKEDKHSAWHGLKSLPVHSLRSRWKSKSFSSKEKPIHKSLDLVNEEDESVDTCIDSAECISTKNIDSSTRVDETFTSCSSNEFPSVLMDSSAFISSNLFEFLHASLPNIVKGCRWVLLYSTLKHGISFRTLVRRSADLPGPCLLIAGDQKGAIFGGLLDSPLVPTAKRKYQGTNNTFIFTTIYGAPRLFRPTGANRFYYLCLSNLLAFGGGGSFALCLDEDLLRGTSGPSETFGNLCLAHSPEFELKNVELWGFTHISRFSNDQ